MAAEGIPSSNQLPTVCESFEVQSLQRDIVGSKVDNGGASDTDSGLGVQVSYLAFPVAYCKQRWLKVWNRVTKDIIPGEISSEFGQQPLLHEMAPGSTANRNQNLTSNPSGQNNHPGLSFFSSMTPFAGNKYEEMKIIGNGEFSSKNNSTNYLLVLLQKCYSFYSQIIS